MAGKTKEHSFEESMERLEAIVQKMESADLPLEELIQRYEEGVQLVKVCSEKLDFAEKRIQIIARKASGEVTLEDFDPASEKPELAPAKKNQDPDEVSLF